MTGPDEPRPGRGKVALMYLEALPGMCLVVGTGRRIVSSARDFVAVGRGSRTGPIRADFGAPAASVYGMMTTFERDDGGAPAGTVARLDDGAVVREFETPVPLPFGLRRAVRTREEIRLVRPAAITFRHLAGPVRGMEELIVVEPLGEERCRVTYTGELPPSGPALRVAYRLIAPGDRADRSRPLGGARAAGGEARLGWSRRPRPRGFGPRGVTR